MKTIPYLVVVVLMLCGCKKSAVSQEQSSNQHSTSLSVVSQPSQTKWEYSSFKYEKPDYTSFKDMYAIDYMEFITGYDNKGLVYSGSNNLETVDILLNSIGDYGWDISWTDGTNFIVKRPKDTFTNGNFIVLQTSVSK